VDALTGELRERPTADEIKCNSHDKKRECIMKVIWTFACALIIALAVLSFCASPKGDFIVEKDKITEIIVKFPGMQRGIKSSVIKTITNRDKILPLVEFANQHAKDSSRWARVDSALSSVALVTLKFMAGTESEGTFGFSANFGDIPQRYDPYGVGLTYFEIFDEGPHRKKNVSLSDVEEILRLIGFSKDDYLALSHSWNNGVPWTPKQ
jgi:hypothetical protein